MSVRFQFYVIFISLFSPLLVVNKTHLDLLRFTLPLVSIKNLLNNNVGLYTIDDNDQCRFLLFILISF